MSLPNGVQLNVEVWTVEPLDNLEAGLSIDSVLDTLRSFSSFRDRALIDWFSSKEKYLEATYAPAKTDRTMLVGYLCDGPSKAPPRAAFSFRGKRGVVFALSNLAVDDPLARKILKESDFNFNSDLDELLDFEAVDAKDLDLWKARTVCCAADVAAWWSDAERFGFNLDVLAKAYARRSGTAKPKPIEFLVPGLIPRGCVTVLVAPKKTGKSTLLTELAYTVASGGGSWCGFDIPANACTGIALLFCGEDSEAVIEDRLGRMGPVPNDLVWYGNATDDLAKELDGLADAHVSLVVVDPSRKYYAGDEDGSDQPNTFMTMLERFAAKKNCPVVFSHHPKKGPPPATLLDVARSARGSGIWLDRPRVILAMLRRADETLLGVPVEYGNPLHNFPQEMMFAGERRLRRDEKSHRHVMMGSPNAIDPAESDVLPLVEAEVRRSLDEGRTLTKTGKNGVYEYNFPSLQSLSRRQIHGAVDALVARGVLRMDGTKIATV